MTSPRISIIVPTANRACELGRTLETLYIQHFPTRDHEVLVVENGPETGARAVTAGVAGAHPDHTTRFLHEPVPGLLSGRHRGACEARGDILVFVDDDIDAAPGWLIAIAESFSDPGIDLVGGRSLPSFESAEPSWLAQFRWTPSGGGTACGYLSLIDFGEQAREIDPNYIWGLNFAIRRQTLLDLRGFHPDIYPDDLQHLQGDGETGLTLKAQEANIKGHYEPQMLVCHRIPTSRLTSFYFQRRAFYQGVCDSYTTIRRAGGVFSDPEEGRAHARRGPFDRAADRLRDVLYSSYAPFLKAARPASRESGDDETSRRQSIRTAVQTSYNAGYVSHQKAVECSPELLEWVLRENYWDCHLPDLDSPRFKRLRIELQR